MGQIPHSGVYGLHRVAPNSIIAWLKSPGDLSGIIKFKKFSISDLQEWIFRVPATAGSRAIMIGIALGTVAQSFRIITGREKSILGD